MIFEGMLKFVGKGKAVGKDDHPNSTKSLKKRRKVQLDMQREDGQELISGRCKHHNTSEGPSLLHKNRHRVGAFNNHQNHNVPDNNNSTYPDSKSLLYMRLDAIPIAIMRQYEIMLSDSSTNNSSNFHRPSNIKIQQHQPNSSYKKSQFKSVTLHEHGGRIGTTKTDSFGPDTKTLGSKTTTHSPQISIKKALTRPLKVLSSITPSKQKCEKSSSKSPEAFNEKYPHNLIFPSNNSTKVTCNEESKKVPIPANESSKKTCNNNLCDDFDDKYISSNKVPIPNMKINPLEIKKTVTSVLENNENDPNMLNKNVSITSNTVTNNVAKDSKETGLKPISKPHDTTDPQFLEKSVSYSTPPIPKCAKKLTLKRSELRKLERLKSQTERLNRFLKKYYLPNLPEEGEEEQCSPEEKSLWKKDWREVKASDNNNHSNNNINKNSARRHSLTSNNRFTPLLSSSMTNANAVGDNSIVSWQNLRNTSFSISHANDSTLLPIIQEDSAEVSSSSNPSSIDHRQAEMARESICNILEDNSSFLMSSSNVNADESFVFFTSESLGLSEKRDRMSDNVKISNTEETQLDEAEGGFSVLKLKGLIVEPLGNFFDLPASLAEDEGFMSPYPPEANSGPASSSSWSSSSSLTFNRFSVSSSGKGSTENDDYVEEAEISNIPHTKTSSEIEVTSDVEKYINMEHENANYLIDEDRRNETWNSHGYLPTSPCGTCSPNSHSSSSSDDDQLKNKRENEVGIKSSLTFSTPISKRLGELRFKSTPRRLVKKASVNSTACKGEVQFKTYKTNGDYVTVHVLQARRLQPHYRSSWKLSIKVSLLPEAETTFTTRSESILVQRNRSWVKIDQKFSFEIPATDTTHRKIFLTFVKRLEKRTLFLGWTTLDLEGKENSEHWLKLRKRKMSTATYPIMQQSSTNHCHSNFMSLGGGTCSSSNSSRSGPVDSPSPLPVHIEESSPSGCDCGMEPKSQLQNSSTMDSGVEDCCEPPLPPPTPSIDLDDKVGQRISLKMNKQDGAGYGFSVVWVSPPRIERLEKGKTGDLAGLRIGDLIIGVNGLDVTTLPNTTIYTKMKTTGNELELELWRKYPQAQPRSTLQVAPAHPTPPLRSSSISTANENTSLITVHSNESCQNREIQQPPCAACLPQHIKSSSTNSNSPVPVKGRIQPQPPPISILKPPPPPPPTMVNSIQSQNQQPASASSSWRIRFNIELLDNEDDCLKQFFICELKFFRKIVAALDRYLIPAQANHLLTPQEINLIFSHVIKIITVTKRILNCVADGSSSSEWKLGRILLSTHSDHRSEMVSAYSSYAKTLGYSAMILSEKMSLQEFARFVLETPVPKGHLDLTSLLFAPFEHLRNICEICEEISHTNEDWLELSSNLKECYADIVCETDFMEPISHVSMKKNPLLSVRDLEKRIVSTTCQALKVCEKGRRWLFGSRLFKKESDGSWTPVWAFLFSDIIVLTSHTTRDRVFFVKEAPIRLEDVVTLHFSLPRKHENEFRLLFGPEPVHQSRLDKILPIHRNKKCNQIILRTPNVQLKSVWKLLLQRQIITLNTRLSKSSSSNFSISDFCERFPVSHPEADDIRRISLRDPRQPSSSEEILQNSNSLHPQSTPKLCGDGLTQKTIFDRQNYSDERNLGVIKEEKSYSQTLKPVQKPYAPDGLSSITKDLLKSRVPRVAETRNRVEAIPEEIKVATKPQNDTTDTFETQSVTSAINSTATNDKTKSLPTAKIDKVFSNQVETSKVTIDTLRSDGIVRPERDNLQIPKPMESSHVQIQPVAAKRTVRPNSSLNNNNNNEVHDFNILNKGKDKCPCEIVQESSTEDVADVLKKAARDRGSDKVFWDEKNFFENGPHYYPQSSPKPLTEVQQIIIPSNKMGGMEKQQIVTEVKPIKIKNEICNYKNDNIVADTEPSHTEVFLSTVHQGEQQFKERLQRNNTPSPSMNNRVEALKNEEGSIMKSKPGSRIMTNATLKCRQQEILAYNNKGESLPSEKSPTFSNLGRMTDTTLNKSESRPGTKDTSCSPILNPSRCQSENGYVKSKPIHTDSPIMSGFGSERTRRRLLYDYKVQRDYPELFGITPRDRRSFIKRLAEKESDSDKSLVAPYYFSPLPTPKFAKQVEPVVNKRLLEGENTFVKNARNETQLVMLACKAKQEKINESIKLTAPSSSKAMKEKVKIEPPIESEEIEERVINEVSLKEAVQGMLRDVMDDETDEDSDESGGHEIRAQEESSNDSGISDEVTEKSKPLDGYAEENERFQSNMAVNTSEVNNANFTSKNSNTVTLLTHCCDSDQMPKAHACNSTPSPNNKIDDLYFVQGEEEAAMAAMVVLKADKATGMDDDYFNSSWSNKTEKSLRTIMAERREAFFSSYQNNTCQISSYSGPSSSYSVQQNEPPLIVKIVDGGMLQSTITDFNSSTKSPPSERVKLTCFEKEKIARVERVESSDDSTSSDLASASPAAENGTTDPSWSSSSSSLAGYASSKEEPSSSAGMHSITYSDSIPTNGQAIASTSSRTIISDLSNGLPSSSFSSFSDQYGSKGPEIVVTQESPDTPTAKTGYSSDGEEEDSILCNGKIETNFSIDSQRKGFLRVESNDSTAENYGDEDDYNFDDEEDLSQCSVATINRYGTYESLEQLENIESEDSVGGLPDFSRPMPRSKARFTFEDEDSDDDNDLFEEDFESDFNFRFPSQIQDNTYSVSRLGPLPPLLEEDFEDEMFDEQRLGGSSPSSSTGASGSGHSSTSNTLRSRHEVPAELGLQGINQNP